MELLTAPHPIISLLFEKRSTAREAKSFSLSYNTGCPQAAVVEPWAFLMSQVLVLSSVQWVGPHSIVSKLMQSLDEVVNVMTFHSHSLSRSSGLVLSMLLNSVSSCPAVQIAPSGTAGGRSHCLLLPHPPLSLLSLQVVLGVG